MELILVELLFINGICVRDRGALYLKKGALFTADPPEATKVYEALAASCLFPTAVSFTGFHPLKIFTV